MMKSGYFNNGNFLGIFLLCRGGGNFAVLKWEFLVSLGAWWSLRLQTSGEQCCVIMITTSAGYGGIFDRVASHHLNLK